MKTETPEQIFFKYAFPAAKVKACVRIGENKVNELEDLLVKGEAPSRDELNDLFPKAVERLKETAQKRRLQVWEVDNIRFYWLVEHEKYVDHSCKIFLADFLEKNSFDGKVYEIKAKLNDKETVLKSYKLFDKNDKVSCHLGYAVEKLSSEQIKKYFGK